ncbi:MAG: hypothetical protein ACT4QC_00365 [Planctomycetaceae bacterium]
MTHAAAPDRDAHSGEAPQIVLKAPQAGDAESDESPPPAPDLADDADSDEIARMERAIEGMREAGRRIADDDLSSRTQDVQKRVIDDLEHLLDLLEQRNQAQSDPSNQQQQQQKQQQQQQQQQQKNRRPRGRQSLRQRLDPQNAGKRSDQQKSRDSQEQRDPARSPQAEEARRQRIVKDVWGHLPPSVRGKMQNSFSERYVPRYEELVKSYYEALAEKSRKRETRPASE